MVSRCVFGKGGHSIKSQTRSGGTKRQNTVAISTSHRHQGRFASSDSFWALIAASSYGVLSGLSTVGTLGTAAFLGAVTAVFLYPSLASWLLAAGVMFPVSIGELSVNIKILDLILLLLAFVGVVKLALRFVGRQHTTQHVLWGVLQFTSWDLQSFSLVLLSLQVLQHLRDQPSFFQLKRLRPTY